MRNPNTTKAYEYLRRKILSGELVPGAFLSAQSLSKDIGVSRTPVREALRQLENDELVTIVPKLGAVVRTLNDEQFQDLLEYREALEVHSAGRAAALRRPEEIEQLETIVETMRSHVEALPTQISLESEEWRRLGDIDIRFHRAIIAAARNNFVRERFERAHVLQRMLTPTLVRRWTSENSANPEHARTILGEHVAIFEAIRDGDSERARKAMQLHMRNSAAKSKLGNHAHANDEFVTVASGVLI